MRHTPHFNLGFLTGFGEEDADVSSVPTDLGEVEATVRTEVDPVVLVDTLDAGDAGDRHDVDGVTDCVVGTALVVGDGVEAVLVRASSSWCFSR